MNKNRLVSFCILYIESFFAMSSIHLLSILAFDLKRKVEVTMQKLKRIRTSIHIHIYTYRSESQRSFKLVFLYSESCGKIFPKPNENGMERSELDYLNNRMK